MHRIRNLLALCLAATLVACTVAPTPGTPTPGPAPTATPAATEPVPATAPPEAGPTSLRVWLPPEFAPNVNSPSGRLLADQLSAFEDRNPGVAVEVRLKAASGPGGLLNALITAANVAPSVLPNLIALRRDDLAAAAAAGLVAPLEGSVPDEVLADYFPFAQSLGRVNGAWAGLPFAADARVLVYRHSLYANPPVQWTEVTTGTLLMPAAESTALTVLNNYLALGGTLSDASGNIVMDPELLARSLEVFRDLQTRGVLPLSTLDYADTLTTWQAFREGRASLAVTTAQQYLAEYFRVEGAGAALLPANTRTRLALADGWSWAIVNVTPEQHELTAELLTWLTEPEHHGAWSEAAQVLPTREASLNAWQSQRLVPLVSEIVTNAQPQPPGSVLAAVGPPLRQALADVLNGRATPFAAATLAVDMIEPP